MDVYKLSDDGKEYALTELQNVEFHEYLTAQLGLHVVYITEVRIS